MTSRKSVSRRQAPADPSAALDDATKQYVDALGPKLGRVGAPVVITSSSTTANSSTLVVTNVVYTFTGINGAIYRAYFDGHYQCDTGGNTCGFYLLYAQRSSLLNSDSKCTGGKKLDRSHPDAGGIDGLAMMGEFTVTANATWTVGMALSMPNLSGSDPGPVRLYANTADQGYANTIHLDRIA